MAWPGADRPFPSALLLRRTARRAGPQLRHVARFELKRIQRELGITFVYVTHDQECSDDERPDRGRRTPATRQADRHPDSLTMTGRRVRRRLHRSGQPLARPADRPRQPDYVEIDVPMRHWRAPGLARRWIETRRPATLMVRPERVRVSMELPPADVAAVRATSRT